MTTQTTHDLPAVLEKHFGYRTFRPLQEEIIQTVLSGGDCLVVMPTGSGKSLCFQVPALCLPGLTLVISPLIALMKDQVDSLRENGVAAAFLNSSQTATEQAEVKAAARRGELKLLYIAPERLSAFGFSEFLTEAKISMIAIDEAHCISEWGHEFRPDYRNLTQLRKEFPDVPCIALTATATPRVREDIRAQLSLTKAKVFLSSFNRQNLLYHVYPKSNSFERLLLTLRKPDRLPAILYCFSRKDTEALAEDLRAEGFACLPYHAGLDQRLRRETQEKFMRDEIAIVTATIAFGMGIDKPDVRTVVHMDLPKNIEGYYQETGRAGRDGLQSDCIFFYSFGDKFKQEFFISQMTDAREQAVAREKLQSMLEYGDLRTCRRTFLLSYFGEKREEEFCGACDRCLQKTDRFDGTVIAQQILSAVIRTGERFGAAHVCDVLLGHRVKRVVELQHDTLSVFGIVKEFDDRQLRDIIGELTEKKFLRKADGQYPTLSVTDVGRAFLRSGETLELRKPEENPEIAERADIDQDIAYNPALFEQLRTLRRTIADEQKVAAFVIFGDRSLREMAAYFPQAPETFGRIYGVSERKFLQYGPRFLPVVREFCRANGLQERDIPAATSNGVSDRQRKRTVQRKGSTYEETRVLLERKLSLADIARERDLKEGTVIQHIEALVQAGVEINIDALRPAAEIFDPIAVAFRSHGMVALSPVFEELDGKFTFDVIRLVRIFLRRETPGE